MTQGSRQSARGSRTTPRRGTQNDELMRAKMQLIAAQDEGRENAFATTVAAYPALATELAEFRAAQIATSGYDAVTITPEIERTAQRARQRAFAAVFATSAQAAPSLAAQAVKSLRDLRQARKIRQTDAARQLGVGVDILASLEHGGIRAASVPERFMRRLGDLLDMTAEQVRVTLLTQAAVLPALMRDKTPERPHPVMDFDEAIRLSTNMTEGEKQEWLAE